MTVTELRLPGQDEFLGMCAQAGGNAGLIRDAITQGIANHKGGTPRKPSRLERRWYASLRAGAPDWTIYDGDEYLAEAWICWRLYSREYLSRLSSLSLSGHLQIRRVADLGCGIGWTTAALCRMFPAAKVTGTNLIPSRQADVAFLLRDRLGSQFQLVSDLPAAAPADLVFASEYFEHFRSPVDHLRDVLEVLNPGLLIYASPFCRPSPGHFPVHEVDGMFLSGRRTSAAFTGTLQGAGYQKLRTRFWNNKPACWRKAGWLG